MILVLFTKLQQKSQDCQPKSQKQPQNIAKIYLQKIITDFEVRNRKIRD